ncbi:hypothetical protein [Kribbella endophytica]
MNLDHLRTATALVQHATVNRTTAAPGPAHVNVDHLHTAITLVQHATVNRTTTTTTQDLPA